MIYWTSIGKIQRCPNEIILSIHKAKLKNRFVSKLPLLDLVCTLVSLQIRIYFLFFIYFLFYLENDRKQTPSPFHFQA